MFKKNIDLEKIIVERTNIEIPEKKDKVRLYLDYGFSVPFQIREGIVTDPHTERIFLDIPANAIQLYVLKKGGLRDNLPIMEELKRPYHQKFKYASICFIEQYHNKKVKLKH